MNESLFQQHPGGAPRGLPPAFPERAAWGTAQKLRAWQAEALEQYFAKPHRDFLAVATPGAGKTTFALTVAHTLIQQRQINRIIVVTPTEHLKSQWADAASRAGIAIDPNFKNSDGKHGKDFMGVAITYAQAASNPALHRNKTEAAKTLVILDEVHHAGDALSWGEAVQEAFEPASRRLALTGTPFRSDTAAIPFVDYVEGADGIRRSKADYSYGYGPALRDHVVRPVLFMAYSGQMRWRTGAGEEMAATLGAAVTKDVTAQAWRTALNPQGEWIPAVLAAANTRLTEVRRTVPDAGGLVIATDHNDARAYAAQLRKLTGEAPTVVLSDDAGASKKIEKFSTGESRWMVAVRMVSEGVDVPRLAVGVYATSTATPLFFAQAVGRFVRARKRGETASVFLPSVPQLMSLANELEVERDHALDREESEPDGFMEEAPEMLDAQAEDRASDSLATGRGRMEALESQASFDRVLFDGGEFGLGGGSDAAGFVEVTDEEQDYLGIPGLLEPEQVTQLLRERQAQQLDRRRARQGSQTQELQGSAEKRLPDHRALKELRGELAKYVSAWSARTGTPHGMVHNELRRRSGGPAVAQANEKQLRERLELLQGWFVGKK